jgi:hypothetical protein
MLHEFLFPIGAVVPYAGPLANSEASEADINKIKTTLAAGGWMHCDGALLNIATYHKLFLVIGTAFGGDKVNFQVPDLRGRFIRGVSGTAHPLKSPPVPDPLVPVRDPDIDKRAASAPGGNAKNHVGSLQTDCFQGHEHNYGAISKTALPPTLGPGDAPNVGVAEQATTDENTQSGDDTPRVSTETRPVNLYLNYIIRFR